MAPTFQVSLLSFATAALAVPYAGYHGHGHQHLHQPASSGVASAAPFPFHGGSNSTSIYATTGTGIGAAAISTTEVTHHETIYSTVYASQPSGAAAFAAGVNGDASCASDVTVTRTEKVYVTVTDQAPASSNEASAVGSSPAAQTTASSAASYGYGNQTIPATGTGAASSSFFGPASIGTSASARLHSALASNGSVVAPAATSSSAASVSSSPLQSSSAESAPTYSAPVSTSSSSVVAPVATSSAANKDHPAPVVVSSATSIRASSRPVLSSSEAAPILTSISIAPTFSAPATSSIDAAPKVTVSPSSSAPVSSAAPSSSSAPVSTSSHGKRGLAYNDASLTDCFSGSQEISWAYDWESSSSGLDSSFQFIPTLKDTSQERTSSWAENAQAAISSGSTHLFSFNEPDMVSQANLDAASAAAAYKEYMNPFAGKAQLCAPSVTNGGGSMGLAWLQDFLDACDGGCHIDCINIHWYNPASMTDDFKTHVQQAMSMVPNKPVFVSEFGCTNGSDDEISTFLEDVMPWMDSTSDVAGYAYFMASDGILVSGTEPSTYGNTYKTYA